MRAKAIRFTDSGEELVKPILKGFPLSVFFSSFSETTYDCVDWHWHEAFQYSLVNSGSVTFSTSGQTMTVHAGDGVLINLRCMHRCQQSGPQPASFISLDVPPSFLYPDPESRLYRRFIAPLLSGGGTQMFMLRQDDPGDKMLLAAIRRINGLVHDQPPFMEIDIFQRIWEIWRITCQKLQIDTVKCMPAPIENDRLRTLIRFISAHYGDPLTLADLAASISVSRSEACRFFRKVTGETLFDYLNAYRIDCSLALLQDESLTIAMIANAVGFGSQSYFTACFRRLKGMTPGAYRRALRRLPDGVLDIRQ